MSELLWKPMGAARSAYITVDRLGAPRCAGGVCATVRDLARVGQSMVEAGARGGKQVVPESWIEDITRNGDPGAWAAGNGARYFPGFPIRYRSKWFVLEGEAPMLFGLGIHGQNLFVDRAHGIVVAKVSSQAIPMDTARIVLATRAASRIVEFLAQR